MKPDARDIHFLLAIARHGTFIAAAQAENISQPALSNRIARLERRLGVQLVDRGRQGASLNKYGNLVLRHARSLDAVLDRIVEEIELEKQGFLGPLVIGCTPISATYLVPAAVALLSRGERPINLQIIEDEGGPLLDKLQAGEIELLLGGLGSGQTRADVHQERLTEYPIQAVVGRANPNWDRKEVALGDLMDQQWALPSSGGVIREQIEAAFLNSGLPFPEACWSCSGMMSLKSLIQHTHCVSLMPSHAFALEAEAGVIQGIKLLNLEVSRSVSVLRSSRSPISPIAEQFVEALRQVAGKQYPGDLTHSATL